MRRVAIFPGTFDPFTKGHEDIVLRGSKVFDEVIVAFGQNSTKSRYFELEEMIKRVNDTFKFHANVSVTAYTGLTADFAKQKGASFILRGLRNTTDFEYENGISQGNRHVNEELETVFLITSPTLSFISSSIIRDLHRYGTDVSEFLPYIL